MKNKKINKTLIIISMVTMCFAISFSHLKPVMALDSHADSDIVDIAIFEGQPWLTNEIDRQLSGTWGIITYGDIKTITSINLSSINYTGQRIPAAIGYLTGLTYLKLYNNKLSGTIPVEIGNLTKLTYLDFGSNLLSGTIPNVIGNLTELTYLSLSGNTIVSALPKEIGNLTKLTSLMLGNSIVGPLPDEIGNLKALTVFHASGSKFGSTFPLALLTLPELTTLNLNNCALTGQIPPEIKNLAKLNVLALSRNQFTGSIPKELGNLANLTTLDLYYNQLNGSIPKELGGLTKLTSLRADYNQLTGVVPSELTSLPLLTTLSFTDNQLVGKSPTISAASSYNGNFFANTTNQNSLTKQTTVTQPMNVYVGEEIEIINLISNAKLFPFSPTLQWNDLDVSAANIVTTNGTKITGKTTGSVNVTLSIKDSFATGNDNAKTTFIFNILPNTAPVITSKHKVLDLNSTLTDAVLLTGVSATDSEDGDISSSVSIKSNTIDISKIGVYTVIYSVTDKFGITSERTEEAFVKDINTNGGEADTSAKTKPYINAPNKVFDLNKAVNNADLIKDVIGFDEDDGNLTSGITIKSNTVDTSVKGRYSIIYEINDSDNNVTQRTVEVLVKDTNTVGGEDDSASKVKPYLNVINKTFDLNTPIGNTELLTNVLGFDIEDGNLTSKVSIKASTVDSSKTGIYSVTYEVSDNDSNITQKTIAVFIKDSNTVGGETDSNTKTKPFITAINKVFDLNSTIDGTELLKNIIGFDNEDGNLTANVSIKSNTIDSNKVGIYSLTYEVSDKDGNTTKRKVDIFIKDARTVGGEADSNAKTKPYLNAMNKVFNLNTPIDDTKLLTDVLGFDIEAGNLTSNVSIKINTIDSNKPGIYSVTYALNDSDNNTTEKTISVFIKDTNTIGGLATLNNGTMPYLSASNKVFNLNVPISESDLLMNVIGFDKEDGDLSSTVKITENDIKNDTGGIYLVTYSLSDSEGNVVTKTIKVTIKEPLIETDTNNNNTSNNNTNNNNDKSVYTGVEDNNFLFGTLVSSLGLIYLYYLKKKKAKRM